MYDIGDNSALTDNYGTITRPVPSSLGGDKQEEITYSHIDPAYSHHHGLISGVYSTMSDDPTSTPPPPSSDTRSAVSHVYDIAVSAEDIDSGVEGRGRGGGEKSGFSQASSPSTGHMVVTLGVTEESMM